MSERGRELPVAGVRPSYETGVFLGLNAIPNAVLVMNSPRCPFVRGLKVFLHHDLSSTVYDAAGRHRILTAEWMGYEDVSGEEQAFTQAAATACADWPQAWIFTFQNISSLVGGFDLDGLTAVLERPAGAPPIVGLAGPQLDGDHLDGYDAVLAGLIEQRLAGGGEPLELALVGHGFWRCEADERANLAEMERLLADLGVASAAVLPDGRAQPATGQAPRHLARLPYAGARSRAALSAAGLEAAPLELPLGLGATVRWITALGELLGREAAARSLVEREQAALLGEVAWLAAEQLLGRRALVAGDAPLARALAGMLGELGMGVEALLLLSHSEAQDSLGLDGLYGLDAEIPIIRDPSDLDFEQLLQDRRPDVVIGNGAFSHLAIAAGLPVIELGYPSHYNHALAPRPYLGFAGLRRLVQDILEACLLRDERSHAGR